MLCYRCGSYSPEGSRQCTVCGEPFSERRRSSRVLVAAASGASKQKPPYGSGALLAGRYRIADPVASGTAGWVLRARDEEVDVDVAVKVISAQLLQTEDDRGRFLKAVKRARKVHHAGVVRLYDEGREDRFLFYTMPYLEGLTLRKIIDLRVEKGEVFSLAETLPLVGQLSSAVDHLDKFGAHGALRPHSVVVLPDILKLTGLPHLQGLPRRPFVVQQAKGHCLEYLAPEARQEQIRPDRRSDIYSLAVLVGEMLTGQVYGRDPAAWQHAQTHLPRKIVAVLLQALAESPADRFDSAAGFFEALSASGIEAPVRSTPVPLELADESTSGLGGLREPVAEEPPVVLPKRRPSVPQPLLMDDDNTVIDDDMAPQRRFGRRGEERRFTKSRPPIAARKLGGVVALAVAILLAGAAVSAALWWRNRGAAVAAMPLAVQQGPVEPFTAVTDPAAKEHSQPAHAHEHHGLATPAPRAHAAANGRGTTTHAARHTELSSGRSAHAGKAHHAGHAAKPPPHVVSHGRPSCPPGMVAIDGGSFEMGTRTSDPLRGFGDLNLSRTHVKAYCIDVYEYPDQRGRMPTTGYSWARAKAACERRGKRLCTEAEWEHACKGPRDSRFPFGNHFDAGVCNVEDDSGAPHKEAPAGSFGRCRSSYGVADMAGNVAEWTASRFGPGVSDKVTKGGAADQAYYTARCAARANAAPGSHHADLGFRCCADLER